MRDRPLQLMLIDEDPRFRLGLKVWLEQQGDFEVVAEAGKPEEALKNLKSRFQIYEQAEAASAKLQARSKKPSIGWPRKKRLQPKEEPPPRPPIDLILLDLGMGANGQDNRLGLQLCQRIKSEFPKLPILVLSAKSEPDLQAAAEQAGASGYGTRSMSVRLLAQLIVQAAEESTEKPPVPATPIDPARSSATQESVAQESVAQESTTQESATQESATQDSTTQDSTAQDSADRDSATQDSKVQESVAQDSTDRDPAAQNSAAQDSTAQDLAQDSTDRDSTDRDLADQLTPAPSAPQPPKSATAQPVREGRSPTPPARRQAPSAISRLDDIPGPLTAMRISMRLSGLQQIDRNIAAVEASKQQTLSWLNRAILDGKKRELTAARWLVSTIWQTPRFSDRTARDRDRRLNNPPAIFSERNATDSTDWIRIAQQGGYRSSYADMTAARYLDRESLIPKAAAALAATTARLQARPSEVQNVVFESVFAKLQRPLRNTTQSPLEIDILRADKKLELLYLVLRQLEELLADLRASNVQAGQLQTRASQVLRDLWDVVNTEFFGKYYTVRVGNVEEEVVTLLQQEKPVVEAQTLSKIPMVGELLGHWLFQEPMEIDGTAYDVATPQAIARSERLLENLIIQVANSVVQPLLNRLSDTESIKKSLYTSRLMSTREIERFRNDLSWRYRKDRLVDEPQAIFESRYNLFVLGLNGIKKTSIYAPRRAELDQLRGLPLVVTLVLETRDAIAPRLRTAFSLVGSSVVYVLTEVLGKGIGLVGRGVLKGVGNIRQEGRAKQKKRQSEQSPPYSEETYSNDINEDNNYQESAYSNKAYVEDLYSREFNEWE